MLEQHKKRELKSLVLCGTCPYCNSSNLKYSEYITNKSFGFSCLNCGWKGKYKSQDLKAASANWFKVKGEIF